MGATWATVEMDLGKVFKFYYFINTLTEQAGHGSQSWLLLLRSSTVIVAVVIGWLNW